MTELKALTYHSTDNDFYRVYFRDADETLYCFQQERAEFELFECTAEGEPMFHIDFDSVDAPFVEGEDSAVRVAHDYNEWLGRYVLDTEFNPDLSY